MGKNIKETVVDVLINQYMTNGYITETEIMDVCMENGLDILQLNSICEILFAHRVLITDEKKENDNVQRDTYIDRGLLNYEELFSVVVQEYPQMKVIVSEIKEITPPQPKEWKRLIYEAQTGNEFAKNRAVKMYLRTVLNIAKNYASEYYCDLEELFQYGVLGLIKAIEKYDFTNPVTFPQYFPLYVRQTMQRYGEMKGILLRYPAHLKERLYPIISKLSELVSNNDWNGMLDSLSDSYIQELTNGDVSLISALRTYEELNEDIIDVSDWELEVEREEVSELLKDALDTLTVRQREILISRYGLDNGNRKTLDEVGKQFGVTRERIRQIESKALDKLNNTLMRSLFTEYINE